MAQELQSLLSQFVGQLLVGCGHSSCREVLCDTGRRQITAKPVRKWTPRSARAIALAVVGGPSPRRHLCIYYQTRHASIFATPEVQKTAKDSSSLSQLVCDTPAIASICSPQATIHQKIEPPCELRKWEARIKPLLRQTELGEGQISPPRTDKDACALLFGALKACLDRAPPADPATLIGTYKLLYQASTAGRGVPAPFNIKPALTVLDLLDQPVFKGLLGTLCQIVAQRSAFDWRVDTGPGTDATHNHSLASLLAAEVTALGSSQGSVVLVWLHRLFHEHWAGQLTLPANFADQTKSEAIMFGVLQFYDSLEQPLNTSITAVWHLVMTRVKPVDFAKTWLGLHRQSQVHFGDYFFLFDEAHVAQYFRTANYLVMRGAYSTSDKVAKHRQQIHLQALQGDFMGQLKHAEEQYLLLDVSRENILQSTFDRLWHRREEELLRPLKVRLGEMADLEVGQDLGGVQIEFFNLVCRAMLSEDLGMFTGLENGLSYFRPGSLQPLHMFELLGVLLGLAVYNGITLPVNFPIVFYKRLLGEEILNIDDIADGWPTNAQSLRYVRDTVGAEQDLALSFPMEANGVRLYGSVTSSFRRQGHQLPWLFEVSEAVSIHHPAAEIELAQLNWPGWQFLWEDEALEITGDLRGFYCGEYAGHLAQGVVMPQLEACVRGFHRLLPPSRLQILRWPKALKLLVEGSPTVNIDELRTTAQYDGPKLSHYVHEFWQVVASWPQERQMQLVKFVTAAERMPSGGAMPLTFIVKLCPEMRDDQLPTASTCFGMLSMPVYSSMQLLDERFSLALREGLEGFGMG